VSQKTSVRLFFDTFFGAFWGQKIHPTAKASKQTNRNLPARNTLVQLLALYTDPGASQSRNA